MSQCAGKIDSMVAEQPQVLGAGQRRTLAGPQKSAMLLFADRIDGLRHLPHDVEPIEDDLLVAGGQAVPGARGARVVVPPTKTASLSRRGARSGARDRTIRRVKALGRRRWKKASGDHQHARVEHAFFRYTSIVGDCLRARSSSGQRREAVLACHVLNRMTELGRPVSYRIGR